jgi:hypothetical protein
MDDLIRHVDKKVLTKRGYPPMPLEKYKFFQKVEFDFLLRRNYFASCVKLILQAFTKEVKETKSCFQNRLKKLIIAIIYISIIIKLF